MTRRLRNSATDAGATAVEYSLMVAFIAGVIIATIIVLGQRVFNLFGSVPTF